MRTYIDRTDQTERAAFWLRRLRFRIANILDYNVAMQTAPYVLWNTEHAARQVIQAVQKLQRVPKTAHLSSVVSDLLPRGTYGYRMPEHFYRQA